MERNFTFQQDAFDDFFDWSNALVVGGLTNHDPVVTFQLVTPTDKKR